MLVQWIRFLVCLVALPGVLSQGLGLDALPPCAVTCLETALSNSPCAATNQTCMCGSAALLSEATSCIMAGCTMKEALFTKNTTMTVCGAPFRNKTPSYIALADAFGIISGIFIVQRFAYKIFSKIELGLDDWFILVTMISGIPSSVITVYGTSANGLGKDIWTLTFAQITNFGFYFYFMTGLYFLQVTLLKLSMLFFYLRIFPKKQTRRVLWGTVAFNCVFAAIFVLVSILQCKPISYFWTKWDGEHEGKCANIGAIGWANAAISIALDIWMISIPMSQLKSLNLDWKKKIGVGMMFGVGTFVTIVSILRLRSLVKLGNDSQNPTWDYIPVSIWSNVEINVGIICACMPSIRLLLVRLFPKIVGTSRQHYHSNYATNQNRSRGQGRPRLGNSAVSNAERTQHDSRPESKKGINYQTTYEVSYGDNDHDEVELVDVRQLNFKSSRSDVSD